MSARKKSKAKQDLDNVMKGLRTMKKLRNLVIGLLITVLALMMAGCSGGAINGEVTPAEPNPSATDSLSTADPNANAGNVALLSIGTSTIGGAWYPMGGALANVISSYVPNAKASATPSAATVENTQAVMNGIMEIGMATADIPYQVYHGEHEEIPQYEDFRTLTMFSNNIICMLVKDNSPIRSIEDIRGKKLGTGVAGSSAFIIAEKILNAYGIDVDKDLNLYQGGISQQAEALKDGNIDAFIMTFPQGGAAPGLVELDTTEKIRFINMDSEKLKEVNQSSPVFTIGEIPAGYVSSLTEPVNTLVIGCVFMVDASMDEELCYQITKAMFEHKDELDAIHSAWMETNEKTAAVNCPFPLHPGAERYYKEAGFDISVLP